LTTTKLRLWKDRLSYKTGFFYLEKNSKKIVKKLYLKCNYHDHELMD
jgi:hypothetical protein